MIFKYLPHSVGCLFPLWIVSFMYNFLKFSWSPVCFFFCCQCLWVIGFGSDFLDMLWSFIPMISSQSFIVLHLGLTAFFCMRISTFPSTICWKDCPFPIEWSWHPCQKSFDCVCEDLLPGLCFIPLVFMSVFMPIPHIWLL